MNLPQAIQTDYGQEINDQVQQYDGYFCFHCAAASATILYGCVAIFLLLLLLPFLVLFEQCSHFGVSFSLSTIYRIVCSFFICHNTRAQTLEILALLAQRRTKPKAT